MNTPWADAPKEVLKEVEDWKGIHNAPGKRYLADMIAPLMIEADMQEDLEEMEREMYENTERERVRIMAEVQRKKVEVEKQKQAEEAAKAALQAQSHLGTIVVRGGPKGELITTPLKSLAHARTALLPGSSTVTSQELAAILKKSKRNPYAKQYERASAPGSGEEEDGDVDYVGDDDDDDSEVDDFLAPKKPKAPVVSVVEDPNMLIKKYAAAESCQTPFQQGWHREVVFRTNASLSETRFPRADIYYFPPSSATKMKQVKLRTLKEVLRWMRLNRAYALPAECFCFVSGKIYKEPEEVFRMAHRKAPLQYKGPE